MTNSGRDTSCLVLRQRLLVETNPSQAFSAETEITITNKDACNDNLEPSGNKTDESLFGRVDASKFFVVFKSMLESDKIDMIAHALYRL